MLQNIKVLLGLTTSDKDELLLLLIQNAIEFAQNYTNNTICGMESTISRMVVFDYNRLGTEGINSESYSGANFNYSTEYPDSIMLALKKKRKLVVF